MSAVGKKCLDEDRDGYYIGDNPTTSACNTRLDFKGVEKATCDCPDLRVGQVCAGAALTKDRLTELFNPETIAKQLRGRQLHPGVPDTPGNGIDEDCDGQDLPLRKATTSLSATPATGTKACSDEDRDGYYIRDNPTTSACNTRLDFRGVERSVTVRN